MSSAGAETLASPHTRAYLPFLARLLFVAGLLVIGGAAFRDVSDVLAALLSSALFALGIALGGGIFIATQGAAGATWWRPVAKVPLLMLRAFPVPAVVIGLVLFLGLDRLYPWARADEVAASPLLQAKAVFLNTPFFLFRAVLVLVLWLGLAASLRRRVAEGARSLRHTSVLFLVTLGPTLTIASWDWAMSMEPEWFSTMYGVTLFASYFACGIAAVIVLSILLEGTELLPQSLSPALLHDLGKLLFAFSAFWAYVWFCEFLLIWYANIPEESTHFVARQTGGWEVLFWLHPALCFVVPFVTLMSVGAKKHRGTLFQVACFVLVGHWLGTYLMVQPSREALAGFPWLTIVASAAVVAAMVLLVRRLERVERGAP